MMLRYLLEKEFKQIWRDRFLPKIIFIVPFLQLAILPFAADFEMKRINLAVVDHDRSSESVRLVEKALASGYFVDAGRYVTYDEALTSVEGDRSDIILEIPPHFERDLTRRFGKRLSDPYRPGLWRRIIRTESYAGGTDVVRFGDQSLQSSPEL